MMLTPSVARYNVAYTVHVHTVVTVKHCPLRRQRRNFRGTGVRTPHFFREGTYPLTFCDHLVPQCYKSKTRCLPEVYTESMQDCSVVSSSQNVYKLTTEQSVFARHCHGTAATALINI